MNVKFIVEFEGPQCIEFIEFFQKIAKISVSHIFYLYILGNLLINHATQASFGSTNFFLAYVTCAFTKLLIVNKNC